MSIAHQSSWLKQRHSGVLLHLSCMPGDYGIGNLGEAAHRFVDFLSSCGFSCWQMCPLGPTGYGDSPYQSFSSAAGNPYFIDLKEFEKRAWLLPEETASLKSLPDDHVDYGALYATFWPLMATAKQRFDDDPSAKSERKAFAGFKRHHRDWLHPFSLFMALKELHLGMPWYGWADPWKDWKSVASMAIPDDIAAAADTHAFLQFIFFQQWDKLKQRSHKKGITLIGDIPIFVAYDSADCWQDPELFTLDSQGLLLHGAGVPPDYFSKTGQRWGNPLYRWEVHQDTGFDWWMRRLTRTFELTDILRIDHFRAFDSYWCIDGMAETAEQGVWLRAPGHAFFNAVRQNLPEARFIAEDLGYITRDVVELRKSTGLPGMKILQFAFGHDEENAHLPHGFEPNSVVYTGTHDNDTTLGWLNKLEDNNLTNVTEYFGLSGTDSAWPIIRAAFASPSRLAVIPLQDLMDLGSRARMNIPGTPSGNWRWRYTPDQLDKLESNEQERLLLWHTIFDRKPHMSPVSTS